jgi:calcineurin-like phosphoesterase
MGFFSAMARVSLVVSTPLTHVSDHFDHQVLPGGTAYMSDAGMTGDYELDHRHVQKGKAAASFTTEVSLRASSSRHLAWVKPTMRPGCGSLTVRSQRPIDQRLPGFWAG